jgi:hypothetical protein
MYKRNCATDKCKIMRPIQTQGSFNTVPIIAFEPTITGTYLEIRREVTYGKHICQDTS